MVDDERLRQLKELCEQADKLREAAEKLCQELAEQLERSRARHPPPARDRRRVPRNR